jgi:hypothetical protein
MNFWRTVLAKKTWVKIRKVLVKVGDSYLFIAPEPAVTANTPAQARQEDPQFVPKV